MYTCSLSSLWLLRSLYLYGTFTCTVLWSCVCVHVRWSPCTLWGNPINLFVCTWCVLSQLGCCWGSCLWQNLYGPRWFTPTPNTLALIGCQNGFSALLLVDQLAVGILNYHHLDNQWATWLKCHLLRSSNLLISLIIIFDLSPRNLNSVASMHHSSL